MDGGGHDSNPVGPLERLLEFYRDRDFPTVLIDSTAKSRKPLPPRVKRLTPETKFELVRRYLEGESALALSRDLGIHRTTALAILDAAGVKRPVKVMTEAKIKKAIALYESGKSFAVVGKKLGVSPETIRHEFINRGVKIRGAHERTQIADQCATGPSQSSPSTEVGKIRKVSKRKGDASKNG